MKISSQLWIQEGVTINKMQRAMLRHHRYKGKSIYIIYTSPSPQLLFEISLAKFLTNKHKDCYLLGIASTKQEALQYVAYLIDNLYNKKIVTYSMLQC